MTDAPRTRAPLLKALTSQEELVAVMLGHGHNYHDIAERIGCAPRTVATHAENASRKIPGDLPAQMKLVTWMRGAPLDVLTGAWLRSPSGAYRMAANSAVASSEPRQAHE